MYPILEQELQKKKITQQKLAKAIGLGTTTISKKLNGSSDISLLEAQKIKKFLLFEGSIELLFKTDFTDMA